MESASMVFFFLKLVPVLSAIATFISSLKGIAPGPIAGTVGGPGELLNRAAF